MGAVKTTLIRSSEDMGQVIKQRRKALGMSQEMLASLTGVAQPNLSKIERGQGTATLETYLRLLSTLGLELSVGTE